MPKPKSKETTEDGETKASEDTSRVAMESPKEVASVADDIQLPFDLSRVNPKTLAKADALMEGTGFSIKKLADWANSVEIRMQVMAENLPQYVRQGIEAAIQETQRKYLAAQQRLPQASGGGGQGGGNIGQFMQMLSMFGGGGMDSEMLELTKEFQKVSIDRMRKDMDFTDAIKNAVVTKIAGQAVSNIVGK